MTLQWVLFSVRVFPWPRNLKRSPELRLPDSHKSIRVESTPASEPKSAPVCSNIFARGAKSKAPTPVHSVIARSGVVLLKLSDCRSSRKCPQFVGNRQDEENCSGNKSSRIIFCTNAAPIMPCDVIAGDLQLPSLGQWFLTEVLSLRYKLPSRYK